MRSPLAIAVCAGLGAAACVLAQSPGTVEGAVRDSAQRAVAAAVVYLKAVRSGETITARTGMDGRYRFSGVAPGNYTIQVESLETLRPLLVEEGRTFTCDFVLKDALFDQPNFIVAGVMDPSARGGHGSDTIARSNDALTRATAALPSDKDDGLDSPAATHHRLAVAAEAQGDPLEAQKEYQQAAELEASERNLFDWGAELLLHSAPQPAAEVFSRGRRLFPESLRLTLGLAAALYALGNYEAAAKQFFAACDAHPDDAAPYLFLAKARSPEITGLPEYLEHLRRFADRHPGNSEANYYYAMALWNQRASGEEKGTAERVRKLLDTAVRLDPTMSTAYLQLGIVYSAQHDDARAVDAYRKAIAANPEEAEAYYRLGQAYTRAGQTEPARQALETHERISRRQQQEADRERQEMPQFVIKLRTP